MQAMDWFRSRVKCKGTPSTSEAPRNRLRRRPTSSLPRDHRDNDHVDEATNNRRTIRSPRESDGTADQPRRTHNSTKSKRDSKMPKSHRCYIEDWMAEQPVPNPPMTHSSQVLSATEHEDVRLYLEILALQPLSDAYQKRKPAEKQYRGSFKQPAAPATRQPQTPTQPAAAPLQPKTPKQASLTYNSEILGSKFTPQAIHARLNIWCNEVHTQLDKLEKDDRYIYHSRKEKSQSERNALLVNRLREANYPLATIHLMCGADPDNEVCRKRDDDVPVHLVVTAGEGKAYRKVGQDLMLAVLWLYGADLAKPVPKLGGETALHYAIRESKPELLQTLLEFGLDPNDQRLVLKPMLLAIDLDRVDMVNTLLAFNADPCAIAPWLPCQELKYSKNPLEVMILQPDFMLMDTLNLTGRRREQPRGVKCVLEFVKQRNEKLLEPVREQQRREAEERRRRREKERKELEEEMRRWWPVECSSKGCRNKGEERYPLLKMPRDWKCGDCARREYERWRADNGPHGDGGEGCGDCG